MLSTKIDKDIFQLEEEIHERTTDDATENKDHDEPVHSRRGRFLESVEEKMDRNDVVQVERLEHLTEQVINHLKLTKARRNRTRTKRQHQQK